MTHRNVFLVVALVTIAFANSGCALYKLICGLERAPLAPPTVSASASPSSGNAPLSVVLKAVGQDTDGTVVSYAWDLGDGTTAMGETVNHTYQSPGDYTATVTATDNDGLTAMARTSVSAMQMRAAVPPPPPATRIVLRGVNFDFDKADIRPDARVILDEAASTLRENSGVRIQVGGHTDSIGTEEYNQGLSERRARAVADDLAAHGIDRARLTVVGFGESSPVATNDTRDGRAQNRRVELNVR